ncbi:MAG: Fic family protein [Atopobiaceae bacterium]|nr:Fic family protein [Atopobiaceae bacterium]
MSYTPPFENSARVVSLVSEVSELVGQVSVFDGLDPNPTLRRENRIRTIHSSLLIENNALTLDQVTAVLDGHHVLAPAKDIREVQNAYEAYEAAAGWDPYSFDNLLKAHGLMMAGLDKHPGCLRNKDVGVYAGNVLIHPGSPASVVSQVMGELFEWLRTSEDHPLVKGSVFHYEFEFIHPFMDGNGRTGRLWHSLILRRWRPIFAWMPIETLIHRNQQAYYDALLEAGNRGDSTVFVEFMLETIRDALADVRGQQSARPTTDVQPMATDRQPMATDRDAAIVAFVEGRGQAGISDISSFVGLSKDRTRTVVRGLVARGVLSKHGNGRYTYYTLAPDAWTKR